jgi:hypothetical protein
MMVFTEVIKAVDQFSPDQLRQLREYIQQREQQIELKAGTLNMAELLEGLEEMRAGLTDEEFREIERAMNEEYIEPLDKNP